MKDHIVLGWLRADPDDRVVEESLGCTFILRRQVPACAT